MPEIDLFDAIYTARSIRRLKPDPIPDEIITRVLDAAIRAPSGSNAQAWVFVVVKDAEKRRQLGANYRKKRRRFSKPSTPMRNRRRIWTSRSSNASGAPWFTSSTIWAMRQCSSCRVSETSMWTNAANLPPDFKARMTSRASRAGRMRYYPAVQNIILACRAFGLGTTLTTIHAFFEDEVRQILNLPPEVQTYALMPIGYPQGKLGAGQPQAGA